MSTLLSKYAAMEQQLKQLQADMYKLENDDRLKAELEFKGKLISLMNEFNKSAADVVALIDPKGALSGGASDGSLSKRRKRKLKVYQNPDTGEVVETRGGNHKTLKAWKDEFGDQAVERWVIRVEE